jgi:hypothetical protein
MDIYGLSKQAARRSSRLPTKPFKRAQFLFIFVAGLSLILLFIVSKAWSGRKFMRALLVYEEDRPAFPGIVENEHYTMRDIFGAYRSWHASARRTNNVLVWKTCETGLGDNLISMTTVYIEAVLLQRAFLVQLGAKPMLNGFRPASIDWTCDESLAQCRVSAADDAGAQNSSSSCPPAQAYELQKFAKSLATADATVCTSHAYGAHLRFGECRARDPQGLVRSIAQLNGASGLGRFANASHFGLSFHEALRHVIAPSPELQSAVTSFMRENGLSRRGYIGVHARIGSGVGEGKHPRFMQFSKNITDTAYCIATGVRKLLDQMNMRATGRSSGTTVFLATDTAPLRAELQ